MLDQFPVGDAMDGNGELGIFVDNFSLAAGEIGELAAGDYVRVRVADNGAGIPTEDMAKIFTPFFTTFSRTFP
mgnify:CR=1 FL=1